MLLSALVALSALPALTPAAHAVELWSPGLPGIDRLDTAPLTGHVLATGGETLVVLDDTTGIVEASFTVGGGEHDSVVVADHAYVSSSDAQEITVIDLTALRVVRRYDVGAMTCVWQLTVAADRLFFIGCGPDGQLVRWIDLSDAAGTVRLGSAIGSTSRTAQWMFASADGGRLYISEASPQRLQAYRATGAGLEHTGTYSGKTYEDAGLLADGQTPYRLGYQSKLVMMAPDTLLSERSIKFSSLYGPLVMSPDGQHFVDASCSSHTIWNMAAQSVQTRTAESSPCWSPPVAWIGSSLVYAKTTPEGPVLAVDDEVTLFDTRVVLRERQGLQLGGGDRLAGQVMHIEPRTGEVPSPGGQITVTRTWRGTTEQLATLPLPANGRFAFSDATPTSPGESVDYSFEFSGTATSKPSEASATYEQVGHPWDFDSDGYQDLAVGAPGRDVDGAGSAGQVTIIPGGPTGPATAAASVWDENSPGIGGTAEPGDLFGWALTSGDYDGDGFADLAVGVPGEGDKDRPDNGSVIVLYGSASGLQPTGKQAPVSPNQLDRYNRPRSAGYALASVDIEGNGRDDLVVGFPGSDSVGVYFGVDSGLSGMRQRFDEDSDGIKGRREAREGFGSALAAGDYDADGYGDVAIGIPYDYDDHGYSTGAAVVVPGGPFELLPGRSERFTADSPGVQGSTHPFGGKNASDSFGIVMAAGPLLGNDEYDDLVIAAPGAPVKHGGSRLEDAGTVLVLPGSKQGVHATGDRLLTRADPGLAGTARANDLFGRSLATGSSLSKSSSWLAVSTGPSQTVTVFPDASRDGARTLTQDTNGIPTSNDPNDDFAAFLRFVEVNGAPQPSLAVGAVGEGGHGAVFMLPGLAAGPSPRGTVVLDQDTPGVPGSARSGDAWGWLGDSH